MGQRGSACAWGDVRARERKRDREREAHERGRERGGGGQEERKTGLVRHYGTGREEYWRKERDSGRASGHLSACTAYASLYVARARRRMRAHCAI
jgi:hypothetical protein